MVKTEWFGDQKKKEMNSAMKRAVIRGSNLVESSQKKFTPVDTGNLRSSIDVIYPDELTGNIGTNTEYAPYVELGTSRQSAQPFIRAGLLAESKQVINIAKEEGAKVAN